MRDVLALPVARLRGMPAATTLALRLVAAPDVRVVFTTSARSFESALRIGAAPFAPDEYEAVALAVELERATADDVAAWCRAKLEQPRTITARGAMDGAEGVVPHYERFRDERVGGRWRSVRAGVTPRNDVQQHTTLTFGELLERIGAELVGCTVHSTTSPDPRAREAGPEEGAAPATSPSTETFAEI